MQLQVLQEVLVKTLSIASRFTSSRAQLPVLANTYLKAKGNKLTISTTNLESSFSSHIGAKVVKEGKITIPSNVFLDVISNLNPGPVKITAEKEVVSIKSGDFSSSVTGIAANDFPSVPTNIDKRGVSFEDKDLTDIVSKMLFAISSDETRPILTGMLIDFTKDKLTFVATDGFRLSRRVVKKDVDKTYIGKSVVVPKNILSEISKIGVSDGKILFSFRDKENQVVFNYNNFFYSSRILSGSYPDYEKVIPKTSKIKLQVGKDELLQAIKLASVFARDSANMIKLTVSSRNLSVESESKMSGSQSSKLDIKVDGDFDGNLVIGFNYRFIEEILSVIKGDEVVVEFTDENSPGVFKDEKDPEFLHLVMPLKI